ncbi:type III secretion system needle tip protein SctA [Iodobacter fluviatilis]|uniref:Translocator protein BipD n=1 Tax=Iodobacter fluviatilis TaxID=537 RepID=A0A377Q8P6_9NEIS|nr:type III secretion system needle tip protein SctA [Iodobacter fluviatilis]TCU86900.1 type III secretion system translocon protein (IpaD/SipD family) [Iodobacter fluviatilis]STQ90231.1 Salmonella invasion protein D [Iodobacter fluviatilis]
MTSPLSSTPLQHLIPVPQYAASAAKAAPEAIELSEAKAAPSSQLQVLQQQLQTLMQQGQSLHHQQQALSRDVLQGKPLTPRANQQLEDTKAERQLSLHTFQSLMLANILPPLAHERSLQLALETAGAKQSPRFVEDDPTSSWTINDNISDAIGDIQDGYLGVYENAVDRYIAFYAEFSKILAALEKLINGSADGQSVNVSMRELGRQLTALKESFFPGGQAGENSVLFPPQNGDGIVEGASKGEADQWAKEMGLDPSCVKEAPSGSGKYVVTIDIGPIDQMISNLAQGSDPVKMTSTDFQIWKAGFDSMDEKMKNTLQTLTQKYSNAQSMTDNLIKVLSSTISSLLETDKAFLQI